MNVATRKSDKADMSRTRILDAAAGLFSARGYASVSLRAIAAAAGPRTLEKRTDLRDLALVTIDGADARDYDDAVWAKKGRKRLANHRRDRRCRGLCPPRRCA